MATSDRYARQSGLVPRDILQNRTIGIAGCGAVGRQLALQLASMGASSLFLADFDRVETVNLGPQGWREEDVGQYKVDALCRQLDEINAQLEIGVTRGRFPTCPTHATIDVLFLAVDAIETRRELYNAYLQRGAMRLIVDGRMAGETIRVLTVNLEEDSTKSCEAYERTLFTAAQAHHGQCTSRSTIYLANIAAGLMISQFVSFMRHRPMAQDLTLGLGSLDLTSTWAGA